MELGTVIGNVWATRKEDDLSGLKFLIVQPELPNHASGRVPYIAVDRIGSGVGDRVMVTRGSAATNMSHKCNLPIDALIIGIIDSIEASK